MGVPRRNGCRQLLSCDGRYRRGQSLCPGDCDAQCRSQRGGVARAGQGEVLVKGGGPLEQLGRLGAIAFDKTGTLTQGTPRVTDVHPYKDASVEDLVQTAIAVEERSDHPLAQAIVRYGKQHLDEPHVDRAADVESIPGRGMKASMGGTPVYVG